MLLSALLAIVNLGIQPQLIASRPRLPLPRPSADAPKATINLNQTPAGTRRGEVLTLAIDVVESAWQPEGDAEPEVPVFAFAERGRSPSVPGPLIRVPQGTEVHLLIQNRVDSTLVIGGLRPGVSATNDTVQLAPGATRELQFRLDATGTFFYWGTLGGTTLDDRNGELDA